MERLKRIILYLAGFLISFNIYALFFLSDLTMGDIMHKKVFLILTGLFILTTQVIEGVMFVIYTVVKMKSWIRIILTTVCSVMIYSLVLIAILPRFYEVVMTQQYFLAGALLPISFIGSVIFERHFSSKKQSFNAKLKMYQNVHK